MAARTYAACCEQQIHPRAAADVDNGGPFLDRRNPVWICDAGEGGCALRRQLRERTAVVAEELGRVVGAAVEMELARWVRRNARVDALDFLPQLPSVQIYWAGNGHGSLLS